MFERSRYKLIYKVPILRPRGLILRLWALKGLLQRMVQVFERSRCKLIYKAQSEDPAGLYRWFTLVPLGSLLVPFGTRLAPFGFLLPVGCLFGSLLALLGSHVALFGSPLAPFGFPLALLWHLLAPVCPPAPLWLLWPRSAFGYAATMQ